MPTLRATSISSFSSTVKVTIPSTSLGVQPGVRSIAALTASQASCISLRPDSFENSVWPIPTMAAFPPKTAHASTPSSRLSTAVPVTWSPRLLVPLNVTSTRPSPSLARLAGDTSGEPQRVVRVSGHAEADGQLLDHRLRSGPVVEELHAQSVGGQDVEEDVLGTLRIGEVPVVVDRHVVTRSDGAGDDQRGRDGDVHRSDFVADVDGVPRQRGGAAECGGHLLPSE